MPSIQGYPIAPDTHWNEVEHRREIARTAALAMKGHLNAIVDLELNPAPATTTTLLHPEIHPGSWIGITGLDPIASAEVAAGATHILAADISRGTATVSHVANAGARTIRCAILG